jgi:hypothetical protein
MRNAAEARALNEKMWQVNIAFWDATGLFVVACECGGPACSEMVELTPEAYEAARRTPSTFVVAREHASTGVVAAHDGHCVVELPDHAEAPAPERATTLEFASHHFRALVAQLLDALPEEGRDEALRLAGLRFGRQLAEHARLRSHVDAAAALDAVCAAVRSLGFHAAVRDIAGDIAVIETPTCPLRPLVSEHLEAALLDRGMWAGLLEKGLAGAEADEIRCETASCLDAGEPCVVTLRLHAAQQA